MLYLEYEKAKASFKVAQMMFEDALLEKERLFTLTQPKAITYDKDTVQTSPCGDVLDRYVIALEEERIDEKLKPFRELLLNREKFLDIKERELRKSPDRFDRIYTYRFLDGMSIRGIAKALSFSKSEVHRSVQSILKNIRKNSEKRDKRGQDGTKCDFSDSK